MNIYTGIGSRQAPSNILNDIFILGSKLGELGLILRSGGADGCDNFFEMGCDFVSGKKEIYLPWKNFNNNKSQLYNVSKEALELASQIHPAWDVCSYGAKKLHSRNCCQVLGYDLKVPSDFLICWTPDGKERGGTRTAIVLAKKYNIPIYNLYNKEDKDNLDEFLKTINS